MKAFSISILLAFSFSSVLGQKPPKKIIYDYLALFEKWKLILNTDNKFSLTTNSIFWPDTCITATGNYKRDNLTIQFYCDTSSLQFKTLLTGDNTNSEGIAQSKAFKITGHIVNFKNSLRRIYATSKFSDTILAEYYRGDGVWACTITLFGSNTYEISESVHGDIEHLERGRYRGKNDMVTFNPDKKSSRWLNRYGNPKSFYFSANFIVGRKVISKDQETHYYFAKLPDK